MTIRRLLQANEPNQFTGLQTRFIQIVASATAVVVLVIIGIEIAFVTVSVPVERLLLQAAAFFALLGVAYFAGRGRNEIVAAVLVGLLTIGASVSRLAGFEDFSEPLALMALVAAAPLASHFWYLVTNVLLIGALSAGALLEAQELGSAADLLNHDVLIIMSLIALSIAVRYFVNTARQSLEQSRRNADLLQATAELGQLSATILNLNDLLSQTVARIRERFNFYHVQIFLINEAGDQAVLAASTGDVGKQLLARNHRLVVGSRSIIGQVTQRGEPVIALDTDANYVHSRNPLLPNTRSEMAVPIRDGEVVIGALDVQSEQPDAFQSDDVRALQISANMLANAIRNARLFETQNRVAEENKRLYLDAETNLREIERLNQQLTRSAWSDYISEGKSVTGVTLDENRIYPDKTWSSELAQAGRTRRPVATMRDNKPVVAVPILLRGEVIGAIEVEPEITSMSTSEMAETVQAVAQRLAVSLDNARLFEESQESAMQEQRINDIVARYQTVYTVDDLLRVTLDELTMALGAQRGAIRLGRVQQDGGNGHA